MEDLAHYSTYLLSLIAVMIPAVGLGAGPGVIVHLLLTAFGGNAYSQIEDSKLIENFLSEHKDKKVLGDLYTEFTGKSA